MTSTLYTMNKDEESKQEQEQRSEQSLGKPSKPPHVFRCMSMESGLKAIKISSAIIDGKPKTNESETNNNKTKSKTPTIVIHGGWARDKLRKLGYYHPVDPSHETFPKTQLEEMLARLTECFRTLSCHVSYEGNGLGAECITMEKVEFHVNLFEKDPQTVMVEVQRRSGDSYVFHHDYARPILAVIRGVPVATDSKQSMQRRTAMFLDRMEITIGEEDISTAMEMALKLVTSDRYDARQLGMESLVALTDAQITGWSTASSVTRKLVMPLDEISEKLANTMLHHLVDHVTTDFTYMALKVWSNVWEVAALDMETPLESFCDVLCPADILMQCLMNHVEHFQSQPHEATLACKGLSALCHEMPRLRTFVSWHTIEQANAMGSTAALEQASRTVLEAR